MDINEALDQAAEMEPVEDDMLAILAALEHYDKIVENHEATETLAYNFFLAGRLFQQEYIDTEAAAEQLVNISISPESAGILISNLLKAQQ